MLGPRGPSHDEPPGLCPWTFIFGVTEIEGGFPHSEICGSKVVRTSPQLIAAYHVLHRLSAPRHPPDTLIALDRSHYRYPSPASTSAESLRRRRRNDRSHGVQPGYDRKDQFCFKHARDWCGQDPITTGMLAIQQLLTEQLNATGHISSLRCQISRQKRMRRASRPMAKLVFGRASLPNGDGMDG
jgi:hypothetical protein